MADKTACKVIYKNVLRGQKMKLYSGKMYCPIKGRTVSDLEAIYKFVGT